MPRKNLILISGITAVAVLILVQLYTLNQIWNQKDELFRLKYHELSKEALEYFDRELFTNGFGTAFENISNYSTYIVNSDFLSDTPDSDRDLLTDLVMDDVNNYLKSDEELTRLLSNYFRARGLDGDINGRIIVNYFDLIDSSTVHQIYLSEPFLKRKSLQTGILVSRFRSEDNNYRLSFDYFIDVAGKQTIILREIFISLALSMVSIVVVVLIFLFAYRNLMEERRLSELKTDFINNMTHELKTPLSTITVASKSLEMERIVSDKEKIVETARLIGRQSVSLNHLINLILETSIWERTEFEPDIRNMAIGPVLNDIVDSFRAGNYENADINSSIRLEGITIRADVTYFTTMINNLLSNAIKYCKKRPEVSIEGSSDGTKVTIKISDNGVGISPDQRRLIFDKFYRVPHGDIHKTKGLGLGLYYVERIVKSHEGCIEVISEPGEGSTFIVTLPVNRD